MVLLLYEFSDSSANSLHKEQNYTLLSIKLRSVLERHVASKVMFE